VTPAWSEDSASASISSAGVLTTNSVNSDQNFIITAAFGGKFGSYAVAIKDEQVVVSSLTISGPSQVNESSSTSYTCTAKYSDGETSDITVTTSWSVSHNLAGISADGILTAGSVEGSETITITATYAQKTTSLNVTILNVANTYTLTIETIGSGHVEKNPDQDSYEEGTVVKLSALADEAWVFDGWAGMVSQTDEEETFVTIKSDMIISTTFMEDDDSDSVPNAEEQGPNGTDLTFDGNQDNIIDAKQHNVASLHNYKYNKYITLSCPVVSRLKKCKATDVSRLDDIPTDLVVPIGFFKFNVENIPTDGVSTVTIVLPEGTQYDTYYKYGPTPDDPQPHWYEFMYDQATNTGAIINDNIVTLYFVDGERGDDDLEVNSIIVDEGGPVNKETAQSLVSTPPTSNIERETTSCFIQSLLN